MTAHVTDFATRVAPALREVIEDALRDARILSITPLKPDTTEEEATTKGTGYGVPLRIAIEEHGKRRELVFHTASANVFGHQRRSDRAAEMIEAFDTFGSIPNHVRAIDVGAVQKSRPGLVSLRDAGEFYLLTEYAPGHIYADELREIGRSKKATEVDHEHCRALALCLAHLHAERRSDRSLYRRAIRDLVGSGEGIAGIVDGYPDDAPGASPERLRAIEQSAQRLRWKLRAFEHRLVRTHGDFHPFNVVFAESGGPTLLDAARGSVGDAADDVCCMAINYFFFAVLDPGTWSTAFRPLWDRFWRTYLDETGDDELFDVVAPFLAWRGLVLANPLWYPRVDADARDTVLRFVERALAAPRFDPTITNELLR